MRQFNHTTETERRWAIKAVDTPRMVSLLKTYNIKPRLQSNVEDIITRVLLIVSQNMQNYIIHLVCKTYFSFPSVKTIAEVKVTGLDDWNVTVHGIMLASSLSSLMQHGWIDCPSGKDTSSTDCTLPSSSSTSGISQSNTDALKKSLTVNNTL